MAMTAEMSDEALMGQLGQRLQRRRLDLGLTQAGLAERAGVGKRTVERLEKGASVQLASLLRILRVLELIETLDELLPSGEPRPMDLLRLKGKQRQRAMPSRQETNSEEPWRWGNGS